MTRLQNQGDPKVKKLAKGKICGRWNRANNSQGARKPRGKGQKGGRTFRKALINVAVEECGDG